MTSNDSTDVLEDPKTESVDSRLEELGVSVFNSNVLENAVLGQLGHLNDNSNPITAPNLDSPADQNFTDELAGSIISANPLDELCRQFLPNDKKCVEESESSNFEPLPSISSVLNQKSSNYDNKIDQVFCEKDEITTIFIPNEGRNTFKFEGDDDSCNFSDSRNTFKYESDDTELEEIDEIEKMDTNSDYVPSAQESDSDDLDRVSDKSGPDAEEFSESKKSYKIKKKDKHKIVIKQFKDDGIDKNYHDRLKNLQKSKLIKALERVEKGEPFNEPEDTVELNGGLLFDSETWNKLYKYQRTGVRWLWELHRQAVGGILGDEMGLGKTIQVIVFLGALRRSKLSNEGFPFPGLGASLIVCPPTVMQHWVKEFHSWFPEIRVAVLHDSGSFRGARHHLVQGIFETKGVLITSYTALVVQSRNLLKYDWQYLILDEGHKIRNPDARATLAVKKFRTPHRLLLSGTPMQNSLRELWSLVDFVFPGRIGALPDFLSEFGIPITQGGYANASEVQVKTAYKCACALRAAISPYLLRRTKADLKTAINLPSKNEQVLFCRLTDQQKDYYKQYLSSRECYSILSGRLQVFVGLITLRKLCNHPDIVTGGPNRLRDLDEKADPTVRYGYWRRSGKMIVVESLLKLWKTQNHRVLLFSQSRKMLDIIEILLKSESYTYLRMDGTTPIGSRQSMVVRFNEDPSIFCFLLTTRVGGLGLNLTGADRVILYDPDWNPSTDCQARERAWRIGQNRPVTVYRLLTSGTIEEKIYHRQIFKQFLTNRILKDPKQRRFFKTNDLHELFTLNDDKNLKSTETGAIFAGTNSEINIFDEISKEKDVKNEQMRNDSDSEDEKTNNFELSSEPSSSKLDEKAREKLRKLAKKLSKQLAECKKESSTSINECSSSRDKSSHKKQKNAKFDGKFEVPHLEKQRKHKPSRSGLEENGEPGSNENSSNQDDDYVLKKLFRKSGVHSVLKHDKIVEAGDPDHTVVEAEADKVAKQAVKALSESRRHCYSAFTGIPTWTGKNGSVLNGPTAPRFGPKNSGKSHVTADNASKRRKNKRRSEPDEKSSSFLSSSSNLFNGFDLVKSGKPRLVDSGSLLESIKRRKMTTKGNQSDSDDPENSRSDQEFVQLPSQISANLNSAALATEKTSLNGKYASVLTELRHFVAFGSKVNGRASTDEILSRFGSRVALQDSAVFKNLLQKICNFNRTATGEGIWILKNEFV